MLRASAACEAAGIASASLVSEGFLAQARATARGLGLADLRCATLERHPSILSDAELQRSVIETTLPGVVAALCAPLGADIDADRAEPAENEIVFAGGFDAVNAHFYAQAWSDGLPIVPPTRERVDAFLRQTSRDADDVLGVLLPDQRAASVRSVAVNGVMAGCRPEYMRVLVALVEAMADPAYGVEHSGNTPGGETLAIVNGPVIRELGFNYQQGVMRDGFQANTSIGRFWRLYLRNVAGFLPHQTDKATFGNTWRVVVAENEDVLAGIGWPSLAAERGIAAHDSAVTIARYTGGGMVTSMAGSQPEALLPYLADALVRQTFWQITFTMGVGYGRLRPLAMLSPVIAETLAAAGCTKADVRQRLFRDARMPAWEFERLLRDWTGKPIWNLAEEAEAGRIPRDVYLASRDPNRLVPIVWSADQIMLIVTGDPLRTNCYVFGHNGQLGFPVTQRIEPPIAR